MMKWIREYIRREAKKEAIEMIKVWESSFRHNLDVTVNEMIRAREEQIKLDCLKDSKVMKDKLKRELESRIDQAFVSTNKRINQLIISVGQHDHN